MSENYFRYFLVRAGQSEYESIGVINTNPVAKTSVDKELSEKGKKQAVRSAFNLSEMGACDKNCWIWPSLTQRAYQAAEMIAAVNGVSRRYMHQTLFLPQSSLPLSMMEPQTRASQMSKLEIQCSEDTVTIVSPDSEILTVLQAGITGLDLRRRLVSHLVKNIRSCTVAFDVLDSILPFPISLT